VTGLAWIPVAILAPSIAWAAHTAWRDRHHLPAAPDNRPGVDTDALQTCRHINALPPVSRKENRP
jgi:hypothetical protein